MGKLPGHRMVTMYVDPNLYEQVRCAAYILDELIYQFVDEALTSAVTRRLNKAQRGAVEAMAKQNVAKGGKRRSRHNTTL